jgi:hypothetical protein
MECLYEHKTEFSTCGDINTILKGKAIPVTGRGGP